MPGLCWTAGPDGAVDSASGRWVEWTGLEPEDASGDGWLDAVHPDDLARVRQGWRAAVASGSPFSARFRVGPAADGEIRNLVVRVEPSRDELGRPVGWSGLATIDPIEPGRAVGEGLDELADRGDDPADGPGSAGEDREGFAIFWIASKDGDRLTSVSPSCERLLGLPVAELTGSPRSWADLAHPDDRPRVLDAYARRASGEPVAVEYRLMRPDGSAALIRDRMLPAMTGSMADQARIFGVLEDVGPVASRAGGLECCAGSGAERTLAELVEGLGDLFLAVDGDGVCIAANAQAVSICDGDPNGSGLIGRTLGEILPELANPEVDRQLKIAREGGRSVEFERFLERAGLWFEFRCDPVADGLAMIGRDVTEAKANRLALLEVEERYRLASEAVVGLIYDWRLDSDLIHRSPGLLGLLGIPAEEAEPTKAWWHDRIHPDDLPRLREELARLMADPRRQHYSFEYRVRHRDGHDVDVWDKGVCLRDDTGRVVRVVGNTIDISDRRHSEEALRQADRMKDEFLGMLAHELRNPLSPILSAAQALRAGAEDPDGNLRAIIERQARHMARLVDDLLDVSRISHGKILVEPVPMDAVELVRRTLDNFGDSLRQRGLELRAELPDGAVPVLADPTRLAQCVGNLLHNASKFTEPGGSVTVSVSPAAEGREARILVRDTGIGIAPEVLPTLFRAYSQADRSPDRNRGGLGLGLALVKNLIEMQGGRVDVSSEGQGQGSTFTVRLPLRVDLAEKVGAIGPEEHDSLDHAPTSRSLRLLVVDDRPDMAHILSRMLRTEGHQVSVAGDAEQALEIARRLKPEVVISDIGLPGPIDGYGLAEALRADPETAGALLIAVTGYARADDRSKALRSGFDEHLTKPLDFAELCDRLADIAPRRPAPDARE